MNQWMVKSHRVITNMSSNPPARQTIIDPEGDLLLVFSRDGHQRANHFKVSEAAMRFASPKWKALMLDKTPPTRDLTMGVTHQLHLLYDDPEAMRILLLIAHLQFSKVPKDITFQTLVHVCNACGKYEVKHLVHDRIERWLTITKGHEIRHDNTSNWVWIGWMFDRTKLLRATMQWMLDMLTHNQVKRMQTLPQPLRSLLKHIKSW
jgi:hypothetical protein